MKRDMESQLIVQDHTDFIFASQMVTESMSVMLVEMGFLTNTEEADWLGRISTQKEMALTLGMGVLGWAATR